MKIIYKKFLCPKCQQIRWLKINGICADCRDELILSNIASNRKLSNSIHIETIT
jgi:hypothetical protein